MKEDAITELSGRVSDLLFRVRKLERSNAFIEARSNEIYQVMLKEFPVYFAGDTALGIATDGEKLGDVSIPDIHPIDLRSAAEIAAGECYNLTDFVAMDAG